MPASPLALGFVILSLGVAVLVSTRPSLLAGRDGRILGFSAFVVLPLAASVLAATAHLEGAKSTEFCLSCHSMEPYGESLWIEDPTYLAASHVQNGLVPADRSCYACHTDYTMFGDFNAKLRGLKHVWVHYLGTVPEELSLYAPYQNRECLHCHGGARSFEEDELHAEMRAELAAEETSCLECHDSVHGIAELVGLPRWRPLHGAAEDGDDAGER